MFADRIHVISFVLCLVVALVISVPCSGQYLCDNEGWDQLPDSGFGAEMGVTRVFATVPQGTSSDCWSGGDSWMIGGHVWVTRQDSGDPTMSIEGVEIFESPMAGPPSNIRITKGMGRDITGVAVYPAFTREVFLVNPTTVTLDLDDNGSQDLYVSPRFAVPGNQTPNQFLPYSRTGPSVPCFTGIVGGPIIEACTVADAQLRGIGVGVQTGAALARFPGLSDAYFAASNPATHPQREMSWTLGWFESLQQSSRHDIEVTSPFSGAFCTSLQVPRNGTGTCTLTQEQANEFEEGKLRVRIINREDIGGGLIPADHHIYSDSFNFGDTGSWSDTVP